MIWCAQYINLHTNAHTHTCIQVHMQIHTNTHGHADKYTHDMAKERAEYHREIRVTSNGWHLLLETDSMTSSGRLVT